MTRAESVELFLDTASKNLSLLATKGGKYSWIDLGDPKKALERTNLGIDIVLSSLSSSLSDVSAFYCLLGPGSNTGIRLGLTIAKTVKGIDSTVSLYGIGTLELMLLKDGEKKAVLSDRNGDLYLAQEKDGKIEESKVKKEAVSSLEGPFLVEKEDLVAQKTLEGKEIVPVDLLSLMLERKKDFRDFSKTPKEYKPHYAFDL